MLDVIDIRQDLHRDSGNGLIWTLTLVYSDPPFDTLGLAVHICDGGDCGEQDSARTMSSYPWPRAHLPLQSGPVSLEDYHHPSTLISSVRSSYSHPDLLVIHPPTTPLFQITPVLNTGLSLSEPLQLYKGYNAIQR